MSGEKKKRNTSEVEVPSDLSEDSMVSYNPMHSQINTVATDRIPSSPDKEVPSNNVTKSQVLASGENLPCMASEEVSEDGEENELRPYLLRTMVGKGGFGEVWEAVQVRMNRIVAVKRPRVDVINKNLQSHKETLSDLRTQFRQEALTTANLAHPNIIPVHDLALDEYGEPLMVMKYIRGRPWDKLILEDVEKLSVPDFLDKHLAILIQMAQAVAFAHSRGVIHRDLKPSQIMVGEFGEVLLADWGLAVVFDPVKLSQLEQCAKKDFLPTPANATNPAGTPAFMAPEQTEHTAEDIGPWTDVYLLGGTLYYLLSLKVPHRGINAAESFLKARFGEVIPPQEVVDTREVPEELAELAMRALTYDIEDRIQSVTDFLVQLKDIQTGAGRRRRSMQIVEEVTEKIETDNKSYSLIASCETRLDEATGLWGDNPEVPFLRRIVHTEGCRFALSNGDLNMARIHAESLEPGIHQTEALEKVVAAEALSHQRERQRRLAIWGFVIAVMVIITSLSFYANKISIERNVAIKEQERAFQARTDSQNLINFMLTDMYEVLAPTQQIKPFKRVVDQAVEYYDRLPDEDQTIETLKLESEALLLSATLERRLGNSDIALEKLAKQREVSIALYARDPNNTESVSGITLNHLFTSVVLRERGEKSESELHIIYALYKAEDFKARKENQSITHATELKDAKDLADLGDGGWLLDLLDSMTNWNESDPRWENDMSFFYSQLGGAFLDDGFYENAREAFNRAANIRIELLRSKKNIGTSWFLSASGHYLSLMRSYMSLGEVGMAEGNLDLAIQDFTTAIKMSEDASDETRSRVEVTRLANRSRTLLSSAFFELGQYTAALECSTDALEKITTQAELDSKNTLIQRDLAVAYGQLGKIYLTIEEFDVARVHFQQAIPIILDIITKDPKNKSWVQDLAVILTHYLALAQVYKEQGDSESAEKICAQVHAYIKDNNSGIPLEYSKERIEIGAMIGEIRE